MYVHNITSNTDNYHHGKLNLGEVNLSQYGNIAFQQSMKTSAFHTSEQVRFVSDNLDNDEKLGNFVRTNTPHPKDLIKKKELLKLRNPSLINNNQPNDKVSKQRLISSSRPSSFQAAQNDQLPIINSNYLNQEQVILQSND